jgi:hypothetical protein
MVLLRAASLLILAIWVGGLAVLGLLAAPTIFATLESHDPAGGRALAGLVFGDVFARFDYLALALGAALIVLLFMRSLLGPRPRRMSWRVWIIAAMLGLTAATVFVISPRIDRIRRETTGTIAALPDSDPRKAEFGRLHGLSSVLMIVTLVAGTVVIWLEASDTGH